MSQFQCNACGGIFSDVTPDGVVYFHNCPPIGPGDLAGKNAGRYIGKSVGDERPDMVNENLVVNNRTDTVKIAAAGAGIAPVGSVARARVHADPHLLPRPLKVS